MNQSNNIYRLCDAVAACLGANYEVEVREMVKNNNVVQRGIMICKRGGNIAPVIYVDAFLEQLEKGESLQKIAMRLIKFYREKTLEHLPGLDCYNDYEKIKDHIVYRLVNKERNEAVLREAPHIEFLDLAISFYYVFTDTRIGSGAILITNEQMELWKANTAMLLAAAQKNTKEMMGLDYLPLEQLLSLQIREPLPLDILTNEKRQYGAIAMLYPGVLEQIAGKLGRSYYILPSSVHEVLILPDTGKQDVALMKETVLEVNMTQVEPSEVLSEHVYYYDTEEKRVKIIA